MPAIIEAPGRMPAAVDPAPELPIPTLCLGVLRPGRPPMPLPVRRLLRGLCPRCCWCWMRPIPRSTSGPRCACCPIRGGSWTWPRCGSAWRTSVRTAARMPTWARAATWRGRTGRCRWPAVTAGGCRTPTTRCSTTPMPTCCGATSWCSRPGWAPASPLPAARCRGAPAPWRWICRPASRMRCCRVSRPRAPWCCRSPCAHPSGSSNGKAAACCCRACSTAWPWPCWPTARRTGSACAGAALRGAVAGQPPPQPARPTATAGAGNGSGGHVLPVAAGWVGLPLVPSWPRWCWARCCRCWPFRWPGPATAGRATWWSAGWPAPSARSPWPACCAAGCLPTG